MLTNRWKTLHHSLFAGLMLEIVAVSFIILRDDSTRAPTLIEMMVSYTQIPGGAVLALLFGTGLGHRLDVLPPPYGTVVVWFGFAMVFLLQSVCFGLAVWCGATSWSVGRDLFRRRTQSAP
jgi:hypothetical protein